jgi:hypothetical protein
VIRDSSSLTRCACNRSIPASTLPGTAAGATATATTGSSVSTPTSTWLTCIPMFGSRGSVFLGACGADGRQLQLGRVLLSGYKISNTVSSVFPSGRVDDVINVSGHRIGTAEVEGALTQHPRCAEAAVVPVEHPIKGQGIYAFVTLMVVRAVSPHLPRH